MSEPEVKYELLKDTANSMIHIMLLEFSIDKANVNQMVENDA